MTDLDYAVKAILDTAHDRVRAEIQAAVTDGSDLGERVASIQFTTDETAELRRENAELKARLAERSKGKATALVPQPAPAAAASAEFAELKAMLTTLLGGRNTFTMPQVAFTMPEPPAPVVYVQAADIPAPIVNVSQPDILVSVPQQPAPIVNLPEVAPPIVNVTMPAEAKATTPQDVRVVEMVTRKLTASKKVKRNNLNLITSIDESSTEEDA